MTADVGHRRAFPQRTAQQRTEGPKRSTCFAVLTEHREIIRHRETEAKGVRPYQPAAQQAAQEHVACIDDVSDAGRIDDPLHVDGRWSGGAARVNRDACMAGSIIDRSHSSTHQRQSATREFTTDELGRGRCHPVAMHVPEGGQMTQETATARRAASRATSRCRLPQRIDHAAPLDSG